MQLNKTMTDAKTSGNQFEFSKAHTELTSFYKKHKINPLKCFLVPMVQMPIFLSFFMALRKMAELPVPSMEVGGALWFNNLTAADPFYVLPIASTLTMLAVLEVRRSSLSPRPPVRSGLRSEGIGAWVRFSTLGVGRGRRSERAEFV
ncbi:mitochondrial inner membrane protein OXA1L-like [Lampetra fluviatilis]